MPLQQQFAAIVFLTVSLQVGIAANAFGAPRTDSESEPTPKPVRSKKVETVVYAVWYSVPPDSLARRRADKAELTAASDQLRVGTLVEVTRISNHRSVIVRITDHGVHSRKAGIDICKEAAEELDMIRDGEARVRLRVLSWEPLRTGTDKDLPNP